MGVLLIPHGLIREAHGGSMLIFQREPIAINDCLDIFGYQLDTMYIQMGQSAGRPWWATNKQAIIACETCITVLKIISGDQGEFWDKKVKNFEPNKKFNLRFLLFT